MRGNVKKIGCEILLGVFLLGGSLFNGNQARAQDLKQKPAVEQTLEEKVKSEIEINLNYKAETNRGSVDYLESVITGYSLGSGNLWRSSNIPELTLAEENQVEDIMNDVKDRNINSYQELVEEGRKLTESQQLVLASSMGYTLDKYNHDTILLFKSILPQDVSFSKWQDSLASGNQNGIGVCSHINTYLEIYLNDIGVRSATVSVAARNKTTHYCVISKTQDGTAIIDYGNILITDTKNIERTLEVYQEDKGITVFQHLFFEDAGFKYRLITKDGEHFLVFVGYDPSSELLKDMLVNDIVLQSDLIINVNYEDYLRSIEFNCGGFFTKMGKIKGDSSSPMEKTDLFQLGYRKKTLISDVVGINGGFDLVYGDIHQDRGTDILLGMNFNLILSAKKQRLTLASRIAGSGYFIPNINWNFPFYDLIVGGGISYKIPINNITIEPYTAIQGNIIFEDLGRFKSKLKLSELNTGIVFSTALDNTNFSIDPYYLKRPWEDELGINGELWWKYFGINAGGYLTKSNYGFCPHKRGYSIGVSGIYGEVEVGVDYVEKITDYDGEIDKMRSIEIKGAVKF